MKKSKQFKNNYEVLMVFSVPKIIRYTQLIIATFIFMWY